MKKAPASNKHLLWWLFAAWMGYSLALLWHWESQGIAAGNVCSSRLK